MLNVIALALLSLSTHAADKIVRNAAALKAEASGESLVIKADGKSVGSFDCLFAKPADYTVLNGLIQELGAGGKQVSIDLKQLGQYCELKRTQHRCLYDGKTDGCSPEEMNRLEKARKDGWGLLDLADDAPRFVKSHSE